MTLRAMGKLLKDYGNCYVAREPTKTQLKLLQRVLNCELEVKDAVYAAPGYIIQRKKLNKEVNNNVGI